jgi:hypothetical protein
VVPALKLSTSFNPAKEAAGEEWLFDPTFYAGIVKIKNLIDSKFGLTAFALALNDAVVPIFHTALD